jgi:tRNA uridine 5-carboxymethylaminomethyl modification enzyme
MVGVVQACLIWQELRAIEPNLLQSLAVDAGYAAYLSRQEDDLASFRRDEALTLPRTLDYRTVPGLSSEMVERLIRSRPETLGAASRIPGITPAALIALLPFSKRAA